MSQMPRALADQQLENLENGTPIGMPSSGKGEPDDSTSSNKKERKSKNKRSKKASKNLGGISPNNNAEANSKKLDNLENGTAIEKDNKPSSGEGESNASASSNNKRKSEKERSKKCSNNHAETKSKELDNLENGTGHRIEKYSASSDKGGPTHSASSNKERKSTIYVDEYPTRKKSSSSSDDSESSTDETDTTSSSNDETRKRKKRRDSSSTDESTSSSGTSSSSSDSERESEREDEKKGCKGHCKQYWWAYVLGLPGAALLLKAMWEWERTKKPEQTGSTGDVVSNSGGDLEEDQTGRTNPDAVVNQRRAVNMSPPPGLPAIDDLFIEACPKEFIELVAQQSNFTADRVLEATGPWVEHLDGRRSRSDVEVQDATQKQFGELRLRNVVTDSDGNDSSNDCFFLESTSVPYTFTSVIAKNAAGASDNGIQNRFIYYTFSSRPDRPHDPSNFGVLVPGVNQDTHQREVKFKLRFSMGYDTFQDRKLVIRDHKPMLNPANKWGKFEEYFWQSVEPRSS